MSGGARAKVRALLFVLAAFVGVVAYAYFAEPRR